MAQDAVIALDAELCYGDGGGRTYRTFAYGSPLSVQQPASQAKIQLIDKLRPGDWRKCGPVMMPVRCDTAWTQPTKALVTGRMALPPDADELGKVVFRLVDLRGETLGEYEAKRQTLDAEGRFFRAEAQWPSDDAPPGGYWLLGVVYDRDGQESTRVAPRMVSVNNEQGY